MKAVSGPLFRPRPRKRDPDPWLIRARQVVTFRLGRSVGRAQNEPPLQEQDSESLLRVLDQVEGTWLHNLSQTRRIAWRGVGRLAEEQLGCAGRLVEE